MHCRKIQNAHCPVLQNCEVPKPGEPTKLACGTRCSEIRLFLSLHHSFFSVISLFTHYVLSTTRDSGQWHQLVDNLFILDAHQKILIEKWWFLLSFPHIHHLLDKTTYQMSKLNHKNYTCTWKDSCMDFWLPHACMHVWRLLVQSLYNFSNQGLRLEILTNSSPPFIFICRILELRPSLGMMRLLLCLFI